MRYGHQTGETLSAISADFRSAADIDVVESLLRSTSIDDLANVQTLYPPGAWPESFRVPTAPTPTPPSRYDATSSTATLVSGWSEHIRPYPLLPRRVSREEFERVRAAQHQHKYTPLNWDPKKKSRSPSATPSSKTHHKKQPSIHKRKSSSSTSASGSSSSNTPPSNPPRVRIPRLIPKPVVPPKRKLYPQHPQRQYPGIIPGGDPWAPRPTPITTQQREAAEQHFYKFTLEAEAEKKARAQAEEEERRRKVKEAREARLRAEERAEAQRLAQEQAQAKLREEAFRRYTRARTGGAKMPPPSPVEDDCTGWRPYDVYLNKWSLIASASPFSTSSFTSSSSLFTIQSFPWPIPSFPIFAQTSFTRPPPSRVLTRERIELFLFDPRHSLGKTKRDRVRAALLLFHPDKFSQKVFRSGRRIVTQADQKWIQEGAGCVVRVLNDLIHEV